MEILGIILATIAALFVLVHSRIRRLPLWASAAWTLGTFLFLIIVLPIYFLIHGRKPKREDASKQLDAIERRT